MSEGAELVDAVRRVYDINRNVVSIDPEFLANGAMEIIRFDRSTHRLGWVGCNLHLREVARSFCRRNFDHAADALERSLQGEMFAETLQDRYPRKRRRGEDHPPEYILRDYLTEDDRWFNIDRLRSASTALVKHSDALETETVKLFGKRKRRDAA